MSDSSEFTRTISVYVNSEQAQAAYDALYAKQQKLYSDLDAAQAAGKPITEIANKLKGVTEQVDRASKKVSGDLSPSLRDLQGAANKVNQELARMSKEDAGYDKKIAQAKDFKKAIEEQTVALGRTKNAIADGGNFGEIFKGVAAGMGAVTTVEALLEKGVDVVKESVQEALKAEDIGSKLKNSLEGVNRVDLFEPLKKQADELGDKFKFLLPDDILESERRLVDFGKLSKNQIDQLMPIIINYTAKMRSTLPDATTDILKAFSGLESMSKPMHQLGVELDKNGSFAANYAAIMDQLAPKVRGAADAFEETEKGALASWGTRITENMKAVGQFMLSLVGLNKTVLDEADSLERMRGSMNLSFDALKDVNLSETARAKIIDDINNKYGQYLPNLLTEKSTLDEINTAQALANKLMLTKILTMGYAKEYNQILEDQKTSIEAAASAEIQRAKTNTAGYGSKIGLDPAQVAKQQELLKNFENANNTMADRTGDRIKELNEKFKTMAEAARVSFDAIMSGLSGEGANNNKAMDGAYQKFDLTKISGIQEKLQTLKDELNRTTIGTKAFTDLQTAIKATEKLLADAEGKAKANNDAFEAFRIKVADLRKEIEAGQNRNVDAEELEKLRSKYNNLEQEAKKFYDTQVISQKTLLETKRQLEQTYAEELAALEDKQFATRSEKEMTASVKSTEKVFEQQKLDVKESFAEQLIGKEEYEKQVQQIDSQSKHTQLTVFMDYYNTLKAEYAGQPDKLAALEEEKVRLQNAAYLQDIDNYMAAVQRKNAATNSQDKADVTTTTTAKDFGGEKSARLKQVQDELDQKLELYKGNEEAINEAEADAAAKRQQIESQYLSQIGGDMQKYGSDFSEMLKGLDQIANNSENYRLSLDKQANSQMTANLQQQVSDGLMTQKQAAAEETALKKQLDAQEEEIERKQFNRKKALGIVNAIISTAVGIVKDLEAGMPAAIPLMVATAALGAIQIGTIAGQKYAPSHGEGTILGGDSHSDSSRGNPTIDPKTGQILHYTERGEAVIDKHTTAANPSVIRQLLSAKGRQLPQLNVHRAMENISFANGGIIGGESTHHSDGGASAAKMDELIGHVKNLNENIKMQGNKKITFVQHDYDRFQDRRNVIYQE